MLFVIFEAATDGELTVVLLAPCRPGPVLRFCFHLQTRLVHAKGLVLSRPVSLLELLSRSTANGVA